MKPSEILVITFTKAAANEMKERFNSLMKDERVNVSFGTFHAVFYNTQICISLYKCQYC